MSICLLMWPSPLGIDVLDSSGGDSEFTLSDAHRQLISSIIDDFTLPPPFVSRAVNMHHFVRTGRAASQHQASQGQDHPAAVIPEKRHQGLQGFDVIAAAFLFLKLQNALLFSDTLLNFISELRRHQGSGGFQAPCSDAATLSPLERRQITTGLAQR